MKQLLLSALALTMSQTISAKDVFVKWFAHTSRAGA